MKGGLLRVLYYGIPTVILALTLLALNSGPLLLRPTGDGDDVKARLEAVSSLAQSERWQEAEEAVQELERAWERVRARTSFMLDVTEVEMFDLELAGLRGAVDARDLAEVRIAHRRLTALWNDFAP